VPAYSPPVNETTSPYQFDGLVTQGGGQISGSPMGPSNLGFKAWNFPVQEATGTGTFTVAGSVYLTAMNLQYGVTYSNIYVNALANAGTASAGSCFAGLYNSAGTLVATTNDLSGVLGTGIGTTHVLTFPLATAYTPASSGQFYVGMFFNASGTASFPVLAAAAGQTAATGTTLFVGSYFPYGVTAGGVLTGTSPYMFSAIATTAATVMPPTFTLTAAGTTGAQAYWCGMG
jgi:hypothetical protein